MNGYTMLRRGSEDKSCAASAVLAYDCLQLRPQSYCRFQTTCRKVGPHLVPQVAMGATAYRSELVEPPQKRMTTTKPSYNHHTPTSDKPRGQIAVRRHRRHRPPETSRTSLPPSQAQCQGPDHRFHGVLNVRNQLDRQQRKGHFAGATQEACNRNTTLKETWGNSSMLYLR